MVEADNECDLPCSKKLWDGYGRWIGYGQWKPFIEEINLPSSSGRYQGQVFQWNRLTHLKNFTKLRFVKKCH